MICPKCQAITPNSYKLCPECKTELVRERFVQIEKEPDEIVEVISHYAVNGDLYDVGSNL